MCAVSQMADYGMQNLTPHHLGNPEIKASFQKLLDAAKEFDEVSGQEDCPDPEKEEWLEKNGFYH